MPSVGVTATFDENLVTLQGRLPNTAGAVLKRAGAFPSENGWIFATEQWPRIRTLLRSLGVAVEVIGEPADAPVPVPIAPEAEVGAKVASISFDGALRIQGDLPRLMEKHWLGAERTNGHVGMSPWALEEFIARCTEERIQVELDEQAAALRERLTMRRNAIDAILEAPEDELPDVPLHTSSLSVEQRRAIAFIEACNGRAFIADAVGGRKTTTAIGWKRHSKARRTLVVALTSVKGNWHDELRKFDNSHSLVLDGYADKGPRLDGHSVVITGFDTLLDRTVSRAGRTVTYTGWLEYLKAWQPDLVIVDESHTARGEGDSDRAKAMQAIAHAVPHALLLTATPQSHSPMDRYSQLNALEPGWWGTWYEYGLAFCNGRKRTRFAGKRRWQYLDTSGTSNPEVLNRRMRYVVLARDRKTLGTEIPSERILLEMDLSPEARKEYDAKLAEYRAFLEDTEGEEADEASSEKDKQASFRRFSKSVQFVLELRQISSRGRVQATVSFVAQLVREGRRPVVFAYFIPPLEGIRNGLQALGLRIGYIRGKVKRQERDAVRRQFAAGHLDVMVCQTEAGGVGVNFQERSHTTVTHELTHKPLDVIQTEGRVNRDGQKAPKTEHFYCLGRDTRDQQTLKVLLRRMAANEAVEKGIEEELIAEIAKEFFQKENAVHG